MHNGKSQKSKAGQAVFFTATKQELRARPNEKDEDVNDPKKRQQEC